VSTRKSPAPSVTEHARDGASSPHAGMVWLPGGTFLMGSDDHYPEEAPAHPVTVDGFWMDATAVTNSAFRRFIEATGYVTLAERPPNPADYPDADPALLVPGSAVFQKPPHRVDLRDYRQWWSYLPGADWRHPEGPDSSLNGRWNHPVVHVAYADAEAYAAWAGKALPTEAEWEFAARGGLDGATYAWGNEFAPHGTMMANTWQGEFPWQNLRTDRYERTAPVRAFPPNGYGLHEMTGNVWEWTATWYDPRHDHATAQPCCTATAAPTTTPRKVVKGGSFLCAPNYCLRYRPAARSPETLDSSTCHIGFRCVVR
jgi:formylglycine-generating enzyme